MAFTKIAAAGIGTTETVTVDGLTVINNGSFGGNLSVGGVLTYEDVTNVDSIGIVTARAGVLVGSGITLSKDGEIFATGISTIGVINSDKISLGDSEYIHIGIGSDLKIQHDSNNSIISNSTGELLIDSSIISLRDTSNNSRFRIEPAGNVNIAKNINVSGLTTTGIISAFTNTDGTTDLLTLHADADGTNNGVASIKFTGNTGNHSSYIKGGHTTNGDTILTFHTDDYASGFNPEERLRINSDGAILKGTTSGRAQFFHSVVNPIVQIEGAGDFDRQMSILSSSAEKHFGGALILAHQKSGSVSGNTTLAAGDDTGVLSFQGHDGTNFIEGARIASITETGVGANKMFSSLNFYTNSGVTTISEKLRITARGDIAFNRIGMSTAVGNSDTQVSTTDPKRFIFNSDYSSGYTDASLKLYLFNHNNTRHGFTSGPEYDLQYHASGSNVNNTNLSTSKHTFFKENKKQFQI